jgi:hypothetical protein
MSKNWTNDFENGHPQNPVGNYDTINKFLDPVGYSRKKFPMKFSKG